MTILIGNNALAATDDSDWQKSIYGFEYRIEGLELNRSPEEEQLILDLQGDIRGVLLDLMKERGIDSIPYFVYEQKAHSSINTGLLFDWSYQDGVSEKGVLIIGVTPGSLMEKIGVKSGDIITKINETE